MDQTATSLRRFGCLLISSTLVTSHWMLLVLFRRHAPEHLRSLRAERTIQLVLLRHERLRSFWMRFSGIISTSARSPTKTTTTQLGQSGSTRTVMSDSNDLVSRIGGLASPVGRP